VPAPTAQPRARSGAGSSVREIIAAIDAGQKIASGHGRQDLGDHLQQARARLAGDQVPVIVVGEFKRGKSTLINALLQTAVCPVDADVVTAVPTTVRYAAEPRVATYVLADDGQRTDEQEMPLDSVASLVTEETDPSVPFQQRSVEVSIPHRMLRSGLALVDTPGVGGLDSAHGFLTLGALRHAKGVLFVTDAAQELTGPELEFLRTAAQRCPRIALVVTKIDLYPQWRRIVELDRAHLSAAGLDLPVVPVSSFLRLRAAKDADLNHESGFAELVTFLARDVVAASRDEAARTAAVEVDFVASQLRQQTTAEQAVIVAPASAPAVVAELDVVKKQAARLTAATATWQQTLADGIQDLVSDVEHDLQRRLRVVLKEVEEVIDQSDPQETWEQTEVWLRRQVAMVAVANRDLLSERADELADSVAGQFGLPEGSGAALQLQSSGDTVDQVTLTPASALSMPGGRLGSMMVAARTSFYLPMVAGSFAAPALIGAIGLGGGILVVGAAIALGGGVAKKLMGDERSKQRTYRQQQAKSAARRFVDEVAFAMNKQTRDGLRSTQRQLRDDFHARALLLERSAAEAMAAARRTSSLGEGQQRRRERELVQQQRQLDQVQAAARDVAAGAVAA
jgi:signal recognition particle receptor subunit beta